MANGGRRPGAGRKPGVPNKATIARQERVSETGTTPLDYMLEVMRDLSAKAARRDEMAKAAAPYVHPKLASMQHTGPNGGPIQTLDLTKLGPDELDQLERIFGPLAGTSDDDAPDQGGEGPARG